jgi:hypothetical protein
VAWGTGRRLEQRSRAPLSITPTSEMRHFDALWFLEVSHLKVYKPGKLPPLKIQLTHNLPNHNLPNHNQPNHFIPNMSDFGRQSFTDKASSALKVCSPLSSTLTSFPLLIVIPIQPDSEKSTLERGTDNLKGNADSAASTLQPNHEKSTGQKATDALSSNSNENHVRIPVCLQ